MSEKLITGIVFGCFNSCSKTIPRVIITLDKYQKGLIIMEKSEIKRNLEKLKEEISELWRSL